jgi:hypothetical protein
MPAWPGKVVVRLRTSRLYVAWLAMLAMALIVVMPAISRVMPMTGAMPGMDASCPYHDHQASTRHPDAPGTPADPTERCGYCVLLSHTPLLTANVIVHVVPAAPNVAAPVVALPADRSETPQLSADPRGPPSLTPTA